MPLRRKHYKTRRRRRKAAAEIRRTPAPDARQPSMVDAENSEIVLRLSRIETGYSELDRLLAEIESRLPDPDQTSSTPNKPR